MGNSQDNTIQNNTQSMQEAIKQGMQTIDKQLQEERQQALSQIQSQQTQAPQGQTPEQKAKLEAVYKQLEEALSKNASFIIKTDLSLRGIVELIDMLRMLNEFYAYHISTLRDNKQSIEESLIEIDFIHKRFEATVSLANSYIQQALAQMDNANNITMNLRDELEILHDEVEKELLEIKNNVETTKNTYEKLQLLEASMGNLDKAMNEAELLVKQHEKILQDMRDFVSVEITKAQSELFTKKEEYERDMQATRDTFLQAFNDMLLQIQTRANEFVTQSNQLKIDTLNTINDTATNRINEIKALDIEVSTKLTALKDSSISDLQSTYTQLLTNLNTQVDMLRVEFDTQKDLVLQSIKDLSNTSNTDLLKVKETILQELENNKKLYKQDIDSIVTNALQSVDIKTKDNLNQIQSTLQNALENIQNTSNANTQGITQAYEDAIKQIDNRRQESLNEVDSSRQEANKQHEQALQELDTKKQESLNEVDSNKQQSLQELDNKRQESLNEVEQEAQQTISLLKTTFDIIQADMQKEVFTSNTTWKRPQGIINVAVSIRGGTGINNQNVNGSISSFGSYITALGGAGNVGGNGQYGEYKFAFISLNNEAEINITVGNGGEVVVYYPKNAAKTSHLESSDVMQDNENTNQESNQNFQNENNHSTTYKPTGFIKTKQETSDYYEIIQREPNSLEAMKLLVTQELKIGNTYTIEVTESSGEWQTFDSHSIDENPSNISQPNITVARQDNTITITGKQQGYSTLHIVIMDSNNQNYEACRMIRFKVIA